MLLKSLYIVSVSMMMMGCASSTKPLVENPVAIVNCPNLTPLTDNSFGATTLKLIEVSNQYYKCKESIGLK
jgi:hypothetical protein